MKKVIDKLKEVHRNIPQLLVFLVNAVITVVIFGRGTGKTRGVTAGWIYHRIKTLVRSTGFVLSPTYAHLVDTVIPELQQGWADLGLEEKLHYWLYSFPPEELGIPKPYLPVDNPKYYIFWINGSVTKLVSLDRKALVNSKSFDYGAFVEGRKLNGQIVTDDVMPTIRGGRTNVLPDGKMFGDMIEHHSILIESDLPRDIKGRWFLKYKKMCDYQTIKDIITIQKRVISLKKGLKSVAKAIRKEIQSTIDELEAGLMEMRKDLVYVAKASTLDNLHVLGMKVVKNLRKNLTATDWSVSVLNEEQEEIENCFYSALSKEKHGREGLINYDYVDSLTGRLKHNWKWDRDLTYSQGLDIVMDCNAVHNCMSVLQTIGYEIRLLNYFYAVSAIGAPKDHTTVANMVADYYEDFPTREITLIYNHTMIAGEKAGLTSKAKDVEKAFKTRGFRVRMVYIGQAMYHDPLHTAWYDLLTGKTKYKFTFNYHRCEVWYEACKATPVKLVDNVKGGEQIKKDKSSEKDPAIPPHEATHASESTDQYIQYMNDKMHNKHRLTPVAQG